MMRPPLLLGPLRAIVDLAPAQNLVANPSYGLGMDAPRGGPSTTATPRARIAWNAQRAASGRRSVRRHNAEGQPGNVLQTIHLDPPPVGSTVICMAMSAAQDVGRFARQIVTHLIRYAVAAGQHHAGCAPCGSARGIPAVSPLPRTAWRRRRRRAARSSARSHWARWRSSTRSMGQRRSHRGHRQPIR